MAGNIIKIAKTFTETAGKILLNSTKGDIVFNSAKNITYSSKEVIEMGEYEKIDPNKKIISAVWIDAETEEIIKEASIGQEVGILLQTLNYEKGESISLKIEDKTLIDGDEEKIDKTFSGIVNDKGQALLEENITIE
jgi:acetylglutamate kinase